MSLSDDGNGIAVGTKDGRLGLLRTDELVAKPEVRGPAPIAACMPGYKHRREGQVLACRAQRLVDWDRVSPSVRGSDPSRRHRGRWQLSTRASDQ